MIRFGKVNKFHNTRCLTGCHQSKKEHDRHAQLLLLEKAGVIRNLRHQVPFELAPSVVLWGRKKPALRYVADFVYWEKPVERSQDDEWEEIAEDCKGVQTDMFRTKAHLMMSVYSKEIRLT